MPLVYSIYVDRVVKKVNTRVTQSGKALIGNGRGGGHWRQKKLLSAEDITMVADLEKKFKKLGKEFGRECGRGKLNAHAGKRKLS